MPQYSALIRTFNCERTIELTLASLAAQTRPPAELIIIDSGSTDRTLALLPNSTRVFRYEGKEFNYSNALNQGLAHVRNDYVLIISSHTQLRSQRALEFGLDLLKNSPTIGAAYYASGNSGNLVYRSIDRSNFDGFNGLWNTCSLIKTTLLRKRAFLPEVFSAEDQEWAGWLLSSEGMRTARIEGADLQNLNPRKDSSAKRFDEYLSIAYFTNRNLLKPHNLLHLLRQVWLPQARRSHGESRTFFLRLITALICCRFVRPDGKSKYLQAWRR